MYNLHVLRHSSPSHRLVTRFSSSVLKRTFFERLCSPPGMSRFTLEHSTSDITESRHFIIIILLLKKKTSTRESARLSQSSPIFSNQHDSLEPARFSRISPILSLAIPATEPCRYSPTASFHRAIALHSYLQLRVSVVLPPSAIKGLLGHIRVRGVLSCGPRALH